MARIESHPGGLKGIHEKWRGSGSGVHHAPEYRDSNEVGTFEHNALGVQEARERYDDDYYRASISVAIDPNGARMPERVQAVKATINGAEPAGPKAVEEWQKDYGFPDGGAVEGDSNAADGRRVNRLAPCCREGLKSRRQQGAVIGRGSTPPLFSPALLSPLEPAQR